MTINLQNLLDDVKYHEAVRQMRRSKGARYSPPCGGTTRRAGDATPPASTMKIQLVHRGDDIHIREKTSSAPPWNCFIYDSPEM